MNERSTPMAARTMLGEVLEGLPLTARELEVLRLAAEGLTAVETGRELYLAGETVKGYRKRAIAKLGARNLTHAVVLAYHARHIA